MLNPIESQCWLNSDVHSEKISVHFFVKPPGSGWSKPHVCSINSPVDRWLNQCQPLCIKSIYLNLM
jgi:hypothetical protein